MKCRNCGNEIPDNANICPDCGAETGGSGLKVGGNIDGYFENQQNAEGQQGIAGNLPPQSTKEGAAPGAGNSAASAKKTKKEAVKEKAEEKQPDKAAGTAQVKETDLGDVVKDFGKKAGATARRLGSKAADVAKAAAAKVSDVAGGASGKEKGNNGLKTVLIAAAAVIVVVLVIAGVMSIPGGKDKEEFYTLGAVVDDELFILDGGKLVPLYDDLDNDTDYASLYSMMATVDYKSYYLITDIEYDPVTYLQTGDLILIGRNGKYKDIDEDVMVGSMQVAGDVLWYTKLDKDEVTLCSCVGTKVTEVGEDIDNGQSYIGSPDAGKAYFNIIDNDESIACLAQAGKVEELSDSAYIVGASEDYKKVLWLDDGNDLYLYDGKDDERIAKSVSSLVYDPKTMDCIVIDEDGELSYIAYGKDNVSIDDGVASIMLFDEGYAYSAYNDKADFSSAKYVYYSKDGDLYKADFKGRDQERIIKNFDSNAYYSWSVVDDNVIYWADDDEIDMYRLDNGKEDSYKLDAANLGYGNLTYNDGMFLFINEDGEMMSAKYGDKKPQIITDDAEEITEFYYLSNKVYYIDDGDLYVSPLKEDAEERLVKDFYEFDYGYNDTLYVIADTDEDGGDLYMITKNGKAKEVASKVQYVFYIG